MIASGRGALAATLALVVAASGACAGPPTAPTPPPDAATTERLTLERAIAALPRPGPLAVRDNPAACDCPRTEVLLDGRWLRARLSGSAAEQWLAGLPAESAGVGPATAPTIVRGQGTIERSIGRTTVGAPLLLVDIDSLEVPPAATDDGASPSDDEGTPSGGAS